MKDFQDKSKDGPPETLATASFPLDTATNPASSSAAGKDKESWGMNIKFIIIIKLIMSDQQTIHKYPNAFRFGMAYGFFV